MQSDLCHFSSLFTAIQCITLKVVYAAFEQVLNVKTGWADSSRRMWYFSEDAVPNLRNNITKRIISFRVVSNIFYIYWDNHTFISMVGAWKDAGGPYCGHWSILQISGGGSSLWELKHNNNNLVGWWTDARRPVLLLWIRSAEMRGVRRYKKWNKTTAIWLEQVRTYVPGVCNYGYVPLSHPGNIVMRIETQQQQSGWVMDGCTTPCSAAMDTFR